MIQEKDILRNASIKQARLTDLRQIGQEPGGTRDTHHQQPGRGRARRRRAEGFIFLPAGAQPDGAKGVEHPGQLEVDSPRGVDGPHPRDAAMGQEPPGNAALDLDS